MTGATPGGKEATEPDSLAAWAPLSVRLGMREEPQLHEGMPLHLQQIVGDWFDRKVAHTWNGSSNDQVLRLIGLRLNVVGQPNYLSALLSKMDTDPALFLDILDMALRVVRDRDAADSLRAYLVIGGSAWTVAVDGIGLERRVALAEGEAYAIATTPSDEASINLREAWDRVYGLHPDPSDSWDHSIKAVEAIFIPIVCPGDKHNLGKVVGDLKAQPHLWNFVLESGGTVGSVQTLESMMRLIWPNPDRHEGGLKRIPTQAAAAAVLHLAVTLVQWGRTGALSKK
jgi:hypothetical protein